MDSPIYYLLIDEIINHPSRSFTNEKEEIVQSDLQSLPNRIECDHMDDIYYFVKQLKIQKP